MNINTWNKSLIWGAISLIGILSYACKENEPTPDVPKVEKPCLISQTRQNEFQLNYSYNANNKIQTVTTLFGGVQTFNHLSDTLVEEGALNPRVNSTRTRHLLFPDGRLKSITSETWMPQFGFGLVQASVSKQDYIYTTNSDFKELITYETTYFLDSATLRPLGSIRFKKNGRTEVVYNASGLAIEFNTYYVNPDGTEFLSNKEEVVAHHTEEIGNAADLSHFWLPLSGISRNLAIGKPLKVGSQVPKTFETNGGFSNSKRSYSFRLNESKKVQTVFEDIETDFGFPFTNTTEIEWICP